MKSPNEVKARASKLREVLSSMGHQLKHSESLEVISKMAGYPDWNTHSADIKKQEQFFEGLSNERYSNKNGSETASTSPDHPIIDAIKLDNESLLRDSLSSEVLGNELIMAEAFYQSVVLEKVQLAAVMIEQGADVGSVIIRGRSLLEFAAHTQRSDYVKMLVLKFRHLKNMHPKSSAALPLVISFFDKGDDALEPAKILIDQGADINATIGGEETAILLAGHVIQDLALVKLLVERGADLNQENDNGDTPLIDAAYNGNIPILEYLLDNGADTSHKNKMGHSALDVARRREKAEAISILVKWEELGKH